jgi:hypothetical protein
MVAPSIESESIPTRTGDQALRVESATLLTIVTRAVPGIRFLENGD